MEIPLFGWFIYSKLSDKIVNIFDVNKGWDITTKTTKNIKSFIIYFIYFVT